MNLYEKIMSIHPSLKPEDFSGIKPLIQLRNDGYGDYIEKWDHPTLPEPSKEKL